MGAADPGQHGGDMGVATVEGEAALGKIPHQRRKAALDSGDGAPPCAVAGGERGEIEADALHVGERAGVETFAGAPAEIIAPIGGVGAVGVFRRGGAGVGLGGLDERLEPGGQGRPVFAVIGTQIRCHGLASVRRRRGWRSDRFWGADVKGRALRRASAARVHGLAST